MPERQQKIVEIVPPKGGSGTAPAKPPKEKPKTRPLLELAAIHRQMLDRLLEGGELEPADEAALSSLEREIEQKADAYVALIKYAQRRQAVITGERDHVRAEAERLSVRQRVAENLERRLRDRLKLAMETIKAERIQTDVVSVRLQNPGGKASYDIDETRLDPAYTKPIPDREKIDEAIKNGQVPGGVFIRARDRVLYIQ